MFIFIYMCVYVCVCIHIYIYIYIYNGGTRRHVMLQASLVANWSV